MNFKIIAFVLLVIVCTRIFAQSDDFGMWIDAAAKKKIASSELIVCSEFYTNNDFRSIDRVSIGVEGSRNFFSKLNIGAGYLLMNKNKSDNYELRHRFYATAKASWQLAQLNFSFRERFQSTMYPTNVLASSKSLNYWRNRIRISYEKDSWLIQPVFGVETFVLLNRSVSNRLDEVRYNLSALYRISESTELEFYALLARMPKLNQYILGIAYLIKI